jgi:hypothetical protein
LARFWPIGDRPKPMKGNIAGFAADFLAFIPFFELLGINRIAG